MWDWQVVSFSTGYRCIAPNLAGFGDSATLQAPDTIEGHAGRSCTRSTGRRRQVPSPRPSMGGMVVQQMAAMAPERIGGWCSTDRAGRHVA